MHHSLKKPSRVLRITSPVIAFAALFLMIGVLSWLRFGNALHITEVECSLTSNQCPDHIRAELNKLQGRPIWDPVIQETVGRIEKLDPSLTQARVDTHWPHTLQVSFQQTSAVYQLKFSDGEVWLIDQLGSRISGDGQNLPDQMIDVKVPANQFSIDARLPSQLHQGLVYLLEKRASLPFSTSISLSQKSQVELLLPNNVVAILPADQIPQTVAKLEYLWPEIPSLKLPMTLRELDFRYKQIILRSTPLQS